MTNKVVKRQYIIDTKTNAAEHLLKNAIRWKKDTTITFTELRDLFYFSDLTLCETLHRIGFLSDEEYDTSEFIKEKKAEVEKIKKKLGL